MDRVQSTCEKKEAEMSVCTHEHVERFRARMATSAMTFVLSLAASPTVAQTFTLDPVDRPSVALQLEKPFIPDVLGLAAFSSNLETDALIPIGSTVSLQLGLPVAFAGAEFVDGTSIYLGNLRASMQFGEPGTLSSTIGMTLPTASNIGGPDLAVLVGGLPWLGELEKWTEDASAVSGSILPSRSLASGGEAGLRLGGVAILLNGFENLHVDAQAAGWGRFPLGRAELRGELATSYLITSDDGFGRQFTAYLDLGASMTEMSGHPGVFLRVPLDGEARQVLDLSLGLSVRF